MNLANTRRVLRRVAAAYASIDLGRIPMTLEQAKGRRIACHCIKVHRFELCASTSRRLGQVVLSGRRLLRSPRSLHQENA